jgi:hypothetical protein
MYVWWKDGQRVRINGKEYMVIYEFGRCPRYSKNVPGYRNKGVDYWVDVSAEEVHEAMDAELAMDRELEKHYEMERQGP